MSSASMALLKGKKTAPAAGTSTLAAELEVAQPAAPVAQVTDSALTAEETVHVDVDQMDAHQLEALVKEHEIIVPEDWKKWVLSEKKNWLNTQFGEAGDPPTAAATVAADDAPAPATTKPTAATKTATKAKAKPASIGIEETLPPDTSVDTGAVAEAVAAPKGKGKGKPADAGGADLIKSVAGELENLKEVEARKLVTELREGGDFNFFKLGGVLSVIVSNNWIEPHGSFKDFVEAEHGLNYRRAMYWISIYNGLVESDIPWDEVKTLGWTKLKEIVPVLTKANVKQWVKTASKQTVLQLIETVKAAMKEAGGTEAANADTESQPVTTKTFKLHADQKKTVEEALTKAKAVSNSAVDTVALEMICMDYLGGTGANGTVAGKLQALGLTEALKVFEEAFPQVNLTAEIAEGENGTEQAA